MYMLSRKFGLYCILCFFLGLAIGLILGFMFKNITPQVGFVSDVIAYQAAIIAIAIPLSFQIISQISERYQSGVITRELKNQWQFKTLICLLSFNSIAAVVFNLAVKEVDETCEFIFAWCIFIIFVLTFLALLAFFFNFLRYATDTKFLLDRLFDDLNEVLNRISTEQKIDDKQLKKQQKKFISSLEGIGDILVFDVKKLNSSKYIEDSLRKIKDNAQRFFQIQDDNHKRFEKLLSPPKILGLNQIDEFQASANLLFYPKKHLVFLTAIVNQFVRLREVSMGVQNIEVLGLLTHNLTWLLSFLSQRKDYVDLIQMLLRSGASQFGTKYLYLGESRKPLR